MWGTGVHPESISLSVFTVGPLHFRVVDTSLGNGALGVINDHPLRDAAEPGKGMPVTGQPGHHLLVPDELGILMPRPAQGHDEEPGLAQFPGSGVGQQRTRTEIHLGSLTWREGQSGGDTRRFGGTQLTNQSLDRRIAAAESVLPDQGCMNGGSLDTLGHPGGDAFLMLLQEGDALRRRTRRVPLERCGHLGILR